MTECEYEVAKYRVVEYGLSDYQLSSILYICWNEHDEVSDHADDIAKSMLSVIDLDCLTNSSISSESTPQDVFMPLVPFLVFHQNYRQLK